MTRSANSAVTSSTMTSSPNIGARTYWLRGWGLTPELIGLGFEARDQLVEGLAERSHAFFLEGAGHVGHVDADAREIGEHRPRLVQPLVDGALEPAVVFEVVQRLVGHRVDGLRSDEVVDVERV